VQRLNQSPPTTLACVGRNRPSRLWRNTTRDGGGRPNESGTRRGRVGSFLSGHFLRGGCRQPSGSEGIVVQGSTRLGHAPQSRTASCDTAGCLPVTAGCHEDANSGSRVPVPVDTRWVEQNRAIARWCADRLTALLTATLTAMLTYEPAGRFLQVGLTATLTATLTAPGHGPGSGRARSWRAQGGCRSRRR